MLSDETTASEFDNIGILHRRYATNSHGEPGTIASTSDFETRGYPEARIHKEVTTRRRAGTPHQFPGAKLTFGT
jgi:hypothetical protein